MRQQLGQTHGEIERIGKEQMRQQLIIALGEVKEYEVDSTLLRWWSKCISATICRTASRNIFFSPARINKTIHVLQQPFTELITMVTMCSSLV